MKNKTAWVIVFIIVIALGWWAMKNKAPKTASGEPIKVGGIFALTGAGASQGQQEQNAAMLAIDEINKNGGVNGRPLQLISEDVSLDKMQTAGTAVNKLISVDKVVAIVGPTWDEPAQAIVPITEKAQVPMIGANQTPNVEKDQNYKYFFSLWYDDILGVKALLQYAKDKGYKTVSIITPAPFGFYQYVSDIAEKYAKDYGLTVVSNETVGNPVPDDYRTVLTKVKAKNPDVLLSIFTGSAECIFLKQEKELNMTQQVLVTSSAHDYAALSQCGNNMDRIHIAYPVEASLYMKFAQAYEKKYQKKPETPSTATAYDSVYLLKDALRQTSLQGGEALQQAIAGIKNLKGASYNSLSLNEMGYAINADNAFEIRTVQNGQFVKE